MMRYRDLLEVHDMIISLSELKVNPGKYVDLANKEVVFITKNGKKVAKLTGASAEKVAGVKRLFGILSPDVDVDKARAERLGDG